MAVVGSQARGDADRASDLDLWVIGDVELGSKRFVRRGVRVTLIYTPARSLRSAKLLAQTEVRHAVVLADDAGRFARLRHTYRQRWAQIVRVSRADMLRNCELCMRAFPSGDAAWRLANARLIALHLAGFMVFARSGAVVHRWRSYRRALSSKQSAALAQTMGFPATQRQARQAFHHARKWARSEGAALLAAGQWNEACLEVWSNLLKIAFKASRKSRRAPGPKAKRAFLLALGLGLGATSENEHVQATLKGLAALVRLLPLKHRLPEAFWTHLLRWLRAMRMQLRWEADLLLPR
jgi:hypothetical protein